ncbi:hypothetical protein, partial [Sphingomonas bacterium]|uniref:hypothetical protein n=1 Tax=Sphingomonas bacterium TaxID=1895847 RepID=UPI001C2DEFAD
SPRMAAPYLGQVATKCFHPISSTSSNTRFNSRSPHFARDAIASLRIVLPNWFWNRSTKAEAGSGATATYSAAIEYPAGSFTPVKFAGAAAGTVASGLDLTSDPVSISIPNGALFWVRVYCSAATIVFGGTASGSTTSTLDSGNGAVFEAGTSLTDKTMGGTLTQFGSVCFAPVAILATTRRPSVLLAGDSRCWGAGDGYDAGGDLGELARTIGPAFAYINLGSYGDTAYQAGASYAGRARQAQYCSHVLCEYGVNDIVQAKTGAQTWSALQALYQAFAGRPVYQTTIGPVSTSGDNWATTAGQTSEGHNAARVALNAIIRGGPWPLAGWFEVADAVESARDSGVWKASGTAYGMTVDGTHESQAGYLAIRYSGGIRTRDLTR